MLAVSVVVFTSLTENSFYSAFSKCTNKALGGCCNYFSGFCPVNAANFPCGSPKIGGKPELFLAISSIHRNTQAFIHFIYIRRSKSPPSSHIYKSFIYIAFMFQHYISSYIAKVSINMPNIYICSNLLCRYHCLLLQLSHDHRICSTVKIKHPG